MAFTSWAISLLANALVKVLSANGSALDMKRYQIRSVINNAQSGRATKKSLREFPS
jgi:hypothetical protein